MGRVVFRPFVFTFVLAASLLGGCAATATMAAVPMPGALIEDAIKFFRGREESFPVNMESLLAAVQQGLRQVDLGVDVLEPAGKGYAMDFGNEKLDGTMELKRQTPMLTTISIIVHRGIGRQHSVEQAILRVIRDVSERKNAQKKFDFAGYRYIRTQPSMKMRSIGWYRHDALLEVSKSGTAGWLKIKMPSGEWGYLKGTLSGNHGG